MQAYCGLAPFLHLDNSVSQLRDGATHSGQIFPPQIKLPAAPPHMHGRVQIIVSGVVLNSARLAVNTSYHSGDYQGCLSAGRWQAENGAIWGIVPSSAFYPVLHRVHEESKGL